MILGTFLYFSIHLSTSNQMLPIIHILEQLKQKLLICKMQTPGEVVGRLFLKASKSSWTLGNTWSLNVLGQAALTKYHRLGVLCRSLFLIVLQAGDEETSVTSTGESAPQGCSLLESRQSSPGFLSIRILIPLHN